ncbi:vacuole membrane protein 1 [Gigaspora margarita]|uniref:Vacuole membrane protein 1 n=1 Tax=Gigaspora margarita TaxID=4874 RepID=A0A8H3WVA5_GIGMA|nr:vacuole membrane protein 1 [Gigaspora margarita]
MANDTLNAAARAMTALANAKIRETNVKKESFDDFIRRRRNALEKQRSTISLYTSPILVMTYFLAYVIHQVKSAAEYARSRKWMLTAIPVLGVLIQFTLLVEGAHKEIIYRVQNLVFWYCYWICLGIASSIGLGTGLHTFVLFLGPFIAEVTWAANKCGNLDFEIFGPNRFRCQPMVTESNSISVWSVLNKVQWESFFWGLGTALGELPPYFVARAAALSGSRSEELAQLNALLEQSPERMTMKEKLLMTTHRLLHKLGFFGIFLFASIPNPLFDLAGIICGQFLIPFSTFFGATFLGKAVVKSSIQTIIVILLFSQDTIETILNITQDHIPYVHDKLENMIQRQTRMLRREKGKDAYDIGPSNPSYISLAWNTLFNLMLAYFALSIIETLAISHLKRVHDQEIAKLKNLEQKMNEKNGDRTDDDSPPTTPMRRSTIGGNYKRERSLGRGYESD